jgi:MFS family permease
VVGAYVKKLRLLGRDVRLYLIGVALAGFCYFGFYVVLFNLYLLRLGFGLQFIGLVNGLSWLAMVVCALPAGEVARRWGARRTMIVGMAMLSAGFCLLPVVELLPHLLWGSWLIATWALGGAGWTAWAVGATPFLMAATGEEERDHAFSLQIGLLPLMGFAGSLIAGMLPGVLAGALGVSLDHPAPYRYPLLLTGVLSVPAVLALLATREVEGVGPQKAAGEAGPAPWDLIIPLALVRLLLMATEVAVYTFFNIYLDDALHAPTSLIGAAVAAGQLLGGVAALSAPLLMARWGPFRTVTFGTAGMVAFLLPLALTPNWAAAGLGFIGVITLASVAKPAFQLYHQQIVPPRRRPTMAAADIAAVSLSGAGISLWGGHVIAASGYRELFLLTGALTALGVLLFWGHFRVPRGELSGSAAPVELG